MIESEMRCRCSTGGLLPRSSHFYLTEAQPHYAPDRFVDVEHIKLEISVDLPARTLKGTCTTDFRVVAPSVGKVTFDALDLFVEQVFDSAGGELRFDQGSGKLTVYLRKAPQPGEHGRVIIKYRVTEPR